MLRLRPFFSLFFLSVFASLVAADYGSGGGQGGGSASSTESSTDQATQTSSASVSVSTTSATASNATSDSQGDKQCPSPLMCVTGTVKGSTVTYQLQSTGSQSLGWMAIGFGSQMANTPMVIMWPNSDGTITLSQRQAPSEVMPTPVSSPANVAAAATPLSTLSGSQPVLAFTIAGSAKQEPLIWAFGTTRPAADPGSTLQQHTSSGAFSLDLSKTLSSSNGTTTTSGTTNLPLLPYQKTIVAHAVVVTFGFLFLLPGGVLLARYTRTMSPRWFTGHWVLQAAIGGPFVIVGCILGYVAVSQQGGTSTSSPHKTIGSVLLALYLAQSFLGAFIHYVKIPFRFGRPPQNYVHAVLGLGTIALALYQVRLGFHDEWPNTTGRPPVGNAVNIVWIVWVVVLALLYSGGLAYLPRQWQQERETGKSNVEYRLTSQEDSQEYKLSERSA